MIEPDSIPDSYDDRQALQPWDHSEAFIQELDSSNGGESDTVSPSNATMPRMPLRPPDPLAIHRDKIYYQLSR